MDYLGQYIITSPEVPSPEVLPPEFYIITSPEVLPPEF